MYRYIWRSDAVMQLEHKQGREIYLDFAFDKFFFADPATGWGILCLVFISVLPLSVFTHVEAYPIRNEATCECRDHNAAKN